MQLRVAVYVIFGRKPARWLKNVCITTSKPLSVKKNQPHVWFKNHRLTKILCSDERSEEHEKYKFRLALSVAIAMQQCGIFLHRLTFEK